MHGLQILQEGAPQEAAQPGLTPVIQRLNREQRKSR